MTNFDIAVIKQKNIRQLMDDKIIHKTFPWRTFSLQKGFKLKEAPEHGIGLFSVNTKTGEVCECTFEWDESGEVLLCTKCFLDGT